MRKRMRAAFTLIELMIALLLLYMVCAYIFALFSSGQRFNNRNREYSATTFLARTQMEHLCCAPVDALGNSEGSFAEPFANYRWNAKVENFQGELKLLTLVVKSPRLASSTLQRLCHSTAILGVDCDEFSDQVVWAQPGSLQPKMARLSQTKPVAKRVNLGLTSATQATLGALCGVPGRGQMWGAFTEEATVVYTAFDENEKCLKTVKLQAPQKITLCQPLFTGIAGDKWGNYLYCADVANGIIWKVDATATKPVWCADTLCPPSAEPLYKPVGLALDDSGTILWVAESEASSLRPVYLSGEYVAAAKSSGKSAAVSGSNPYVWGANYRPSGQVGYLSGLAVNPWSSGVFTIDKYRLYLLSYAPDSTGALVGTWTSYKLASELSEDGPSGLACDPYRCEIYINTLKGVLWHYSFATGKFSKVG